MTFLLGPYHSFLPFWGHYGVAKDRILSYMARGLTLHLWCLEHPFLLDWPSRNKVSLGLGRLLIWVCITTAKGSDSGVGMGRRPEEPWDIWQSSFQVQLCRASSPFLQGSQCHPFVLSYVLSWAFCLLKPRESWLRPPFVLASPSPCPWGVTHPLNTLQLPHALLFSTFCPLLLGECLAWLWVF